MSRFTYTKGITHGGNSFHSDDVVATALCKYFANRENISFTYERKFNVSESEINDTGIIVYDIGERYSPQLGLFDHHQSTTPLRDDGQKYSACGLILREFGPSYFSEAEMKAIENNITTCIDYHDNSKLMPGETTPVNIYEFSALSPTWNEASELQDTYFERAVELAYKTIEYELEKVHGKNDIETRNSVLNEIDKRRNFIENSDILAEAKAAAALDTLKDGVVYMDTFMPTAKHIFADKNFLESNGNPVVWFVIHPSPRAPYNISVVPIEPGSFQLKIPEGFNRVVTNEKDYPQNVSFVHQEGFFAAGKTVEGLRELASKTVENYLENCHGIYHEHSEEKLPELPTGNDKVIDEIDREAA